MSEIETETKASEDAVTVDVQDDDEEDEDDAYESAQDEDESRRRNKASDDDESGDDDEEDDDEKASSAVDEDKRNPQYIPKRGVFYEHDDRQMEDEDEEEAPSTTTKKAPSKASTSRWGHDKFQELDQAPKTAQEIVNDYGYDIRNEDSAPRARRRRRYQRGPNKYTRKWQDQQAYAKDAEKATPKKRERPPKEPTPTQKQRTPKSKSEAVAAKNLKNTEAEDVANLSKTVDAIERRMAKAAIKEHESPKTTPKNAPTPRQQRQQDDSKATKRYSSQRQQQNHDARGPNVTRNGAKQSSTTTTSVTSTAKATSTSSTANSGKRFQEQQQQQAEMVSAADVLAAAFPAGHYPNGPPAGAPFLNAHQAQQSPTSTSTSANAIPETPSTPSSNTTPMPLPPMGASTGPPPPPPPYINPNGIVNYGPPPGVQYTPVTVPISVPLVGVSAGPHDTFVPAGVTPAPHNPLMTATPPHLTADVLLAAAAGTTAPPPPPQGSQGYAEVRGGVTYFNPTVQAPVVQRSVVSKRPKAAIPIVDPSQVNNAASSNEISPQDSVEAIDESVSTSES